MLFTSDNHVPRVGLPDLAPGLRGSFRQVLPDLVPVDPPSTPAPRPPAGGRDPNPTERVGAEEGREGPAGRGPGTPLGITGVQLTVSLDYCNATFPLARLPDVRRLLCNCLGHQPEDGPGIHTYARSERWSSGAILAWTPGRVECWASLNAQSLAIMGCPLTLLQALEAMGPASPASTGRWMTRPALSTRSPVWSRPSPLRTWCGSSVGVS